MGESWSADVTAVCPNCGHPTGHHCVGAVNTSDNAKIHSKSARRVFVTKCRACSEIAIVVSYIDDRLSLSIGSKHLWPTQSWPDRAPDGLDPAIRKSYDEARIVLPHSPGASAMLSRRCLQMLIRTKLGITKRQLVEEIKLALDHPDLSGPTKAALDAIREIGNNGAHPNPDHSMSEQSDGIVFIEVAQSDAEFTLETLEMLFDDLYTMPAKTASMFAKIRAQKGKGTTTTTTDAR